MNQKNYSDLTARKSDAQFYLYALAQLPQSGRDNNNDSLSVRTLHKNQLAYRDQSAAGASDSVFFHNVRFVLSYSMELVLNELHSLYF